MIDLDAIPQDQLIARGKLSTVNRRARILRLEIRDRMETLVDQARTVTRLLGMEDGISPNENLQNLEALVARTLDATHELDELAIQIESLKPTAWPKGT